MAVKLIHRRNHRNKSENNKLPEPAGHHRHSPVPEHHDDPSAQVRLPVKLSRHRVTVPVTVTATAIGGIVFMTGCVGRRTEGEKRAQQAPATVGQSYRPGGERPTLPMLQTNASLSNFREMLRFRECDAPDRLRAEEVLLPTPLP